MSAHSSLDREAFQMLLASAFAVQESGVSRQSLSAIVEIHNSITRHERQFEGILALIADPAYGGQCEGNCDRHPHRRSISLPGWQWMCCRICRPTSHSSIEFVGAQWGAKRDFAWRKL